MATSAPPGDSILDTLNPAQRKAVSSNADTVAILAGPGSGKTHTLASRVVYLVDTAGYRPQDVIVATFTVKAAREMAERVGKVLSNGREKKIVLGTFHSISRRYLAAYGQRIGLDPKFGIADTSDSRAIVDRICKRLQLKIDPHMARSWISQNKCKGTTSKPSKKKALPMSPDMERDLTTCYEEYQDHLERSNLLDYDDLLVRCVELLRKFPSCVSNVQAVLIDEYQDTNGVQYELVKLFAQSRQRITIVGDPDQSIYGWRSAEIGNLWRLLREFPKTDEIALEQNYRSSQSILRMSLMVIQQDQKRYQKALVPTHKSGSSPVLRRLRNPAVEAEWIVHEIRRVGLLSGNMVNHSDVAILLRSASLSRHIEHALGKAGIAYRMVGGFKFYDRAEIKILLDYLKVVYQPENNDALARIINVPRRGVGDTTIKSLLEEAETSSLNLWSVIDKHCRGDRVAKTKLTKMQEQRISGELFRIIRSVRKHVEDITLGTPFGLVDMIEQLLAQLDFEKFLQNTYPEDHEQRWANVQEFVGLANDFTKELTGNEDDSLPQIDGVQQSEDQDVLPKFLANVALASEVKEEDGDQQRTHLVTISTIHAAKGLEWPIVFVPAVYRGSIPHAKAEDEDEERRLLYVAMTRAKALLYLSCPMSGSHGNGEKVELSPFLSPLVSSLAKKGPSFDRPVMETVARILGRTLPSNDAIFKSIPSMTELEDNIYPEDPDESLKRSRSLGVEHVHQPPQLKRQRFSAPGGTGAGDDQRWWKESTTTMEQASSFTVSSLAGFVSAGQHQAALTALVVAQEKPKPAMRRSTTKRQSDQKSIIRFMTPAQTSDSTPHSSTPATKHSIQHSRMTQAAGPQPLRQVINPELANRRVGTAKMNTRPVQTNQESHDTRHAYSCFSSSPVKATPDLNKSSEENEENEEPPEPSRSASCLHATTYNMPKGLGGGFRRPAGLGRESLTPMQRLTKPFKPLSINRPS
jgi:DNA helicase-2/ATP-dependent DNA helicase PcrA